MKKTEVLFLPGDQPRQPLQRTSAEIRQHLENVRDRRTEESAIQQAAHVGRAAMHLLGSRLYAHYNVSQQAMQPGTRLVQDPFVTHEVSLHETTVSGEPARVSVVATTRKPGVDSHSRVISVPQHEIAGEEFAKLRNGLFVMDGTARSFASDEPEVYAERVTHSAGLLLDIMEQVEVVLPEATETQNTLAA